ncbi:MAG: hypothetical protein H6746_03050 [Deltaproteobacteria bacterium]|nr:hypothetical protein [Deltaproteobacteria bacterium]
MPIRSRDAFQVLSARRVEDGSPCVLVTAGPAADPARVADALDEVARVHALLDHPLIPRVVHRGEEQGHPFLELDCAARADGTEIVRLLSDSPGSLAYGGADAFIASLREALQHAHQTIDPATGAAIHLGRMSGGNVLFDAAGRWYLVGFGRNFPLEKDDGTLDGTVPIYQATELQTGGRPTPAGDYVALVLWMRSLIRHVDMSNVLGRIIRGEWGPQDAELVECLRWLDARMISQPPQLRPSIADAVAVADRIREIAGLELDPDGFAAHVASLLAGRAEGEEVVEARQPVAARTLVIGPDAAWMAGPDGTSVRLGRTLRRVLMALVDRHEAGGPALTMWDLLEAGWPGERPLLEAGSNRVYVSLSRLRQLGLRDLIERHEDGYRLTPTTCIDRGTASGDYGRR